MIKISNSSFIYSVVLITFSLGLTIDENGDKSDNVCANMYYNRINTSLMGQLFHLLTCSLAFFLNLHKFAVNENRGIYFKISVFSTYYILVLVIYIWQDLYS